MAAESVVEVYRTQENRQQYQFNAALTITYFGSEATLQGLSGRFSRQCASEIFTYLKGRGVKNIRYIRRGRLVQIPITD